LAAHSSAPVAERLRRATSGRVVVIGGANTDVIGLSDGPLIERDSNPGRVRLSSGGVARNIAENLARLGVTTHLVTVFGGDHNARELMEECRSLGIGIDGSLVAADLPGPVYLAIHDERGDMALGLNDMRALECLTSDALSSAPCRALLDSADLVIADGNVPAESLGWLADNVDAPLMIDPVSVAKAPRVAPLVPRLAAVTPNALEAGVLLGREVRNRDQARVAARDLVAAGVGAAFVTCGSFGVAFAQGESAGLVPAPAVERVSSATGAGDAFSAGIALSLLAEIPAREAVGVGSVLADLALRSERTVSEEVTLDTLLQRIASSTAEARS